MPRHRDSVKITTWLCNKLAIHTAPTATAALPSTQKDQHCAAAPQLHRNAVDSAAVVFTSSCTVINDSNVCTTNVCDRHEGGSFAITCTLALGHCTTSMERQSIVLGASLKCWDIHEGPAKHQNRCQQKMLSSASELP
jgi:hypothetical protein